MRALGESPKRPRLEAGVFSCVAGRFPNASIPLPDFLPQGEDKKSRPSRERFGSILAGTSASRFRNSPLLPLRLSVRSHAGFPSCRPGDNSFLVHSFATAFVNFTVRSRSESPTRSSDPPRSFHL
jgi:hypothetical protein